jgi:RNA polymerase sigma factor (TIGR02999 family)
MRSSADDLTLLLRSWSRGDESALGKIIPIVHDELKRLAHAYMARERAGHTLQTTALLNEAYLKLVDARNVEWQDRAHFLAISARLMRRILVDRARKRDFQKRGGGAVKISLEGSPEPATEADPTIVELEDALTALERLDPRKARVVELRYFGGLSVEETAEALGVGGGTVMRDWRLAKVWLHRELSRSRKAAL